MEILVLMPLDRGRREGMTVNLSSAQLICELVQVVFFTSPPVSPKASPPSFSKNPLKPLLKARSGSEVVLECKPQASPRAISLWKKSNEIVQKNER